MGVSLSSALWSPSLQARRSALMSPTAGSRGFSALRIAYPLNYTAAPGEDRDSFLAHSAPTWNRGTHEYPTNTSGPEVTDPGQIQKGERKMKSPQLVKTAGAVATLGVIVMGGMLIRSPRVHADDTDEEAKVQIGFQIAPVRLDLDGKDRTLVGLGSYIVNAENDCNACHNSGGPPNFEYLPGANPYNNQRKVLNPATYLGGGQDFGPAGPPPSPNIVSRNLTPDKTGRPEGGHTFAEFQQIIRNG